MSENTTGRTTKLRWELTSKRKLSTQWGKGNSKEQKDNKCRATTLPLGLMESKKKSNSKKPHHQAWDSEPIGEWGAEVTGWQQCWQTSLKGGGPGSPECYWQDPCLQGCQRPCCETASLVATKCIFIEKGWSEKTWEEGGRWLCRKLKHWQKNSRLNEEINYLHTTKHWL